MSERTPSNRTQTGRGRRNASQYSVRPPSQRPAPKAQEAETPAPAQPEKPVRKKRATTGRVFPWGNVIALVMLLGLIGVLTYLGLQAYMQAYSRQFYANTITEGVTVDGVDVSGLTYEEALQKVQSKKEPFLDAVSVTLHYGENTWHFDGEDLRAEDTTEETLSEAMKLAREGELEDRILEARRIKEEGAHFGTDKDIDHSMVESLVDRIAILIDDEPVDATVTVNPESSRNYFVVTNEHNGRRVDKEATLNLIFADMEGDWTADVDLIVEELPAKITAEELKGSTAERSFFETPISSSSTENRISNIRLAASQFNGMVVQPGQQVSFNETTGKRTTEAGYLDAPGIGTSKAFEDTLGGGVCQVSTTLYNACLLAGLQIDQRSQHSIPSTYVMNGFDAMVNWPTRDLKFTNTTGHPIYIRSDTSTTAVRFWIYGVEIPDGISYDRAYEVTSRTSIPETKLVPDKNGDFRRYITYTDEAYVYVVARAGMTVNAYLVTKKDGEEIDRKLLYTDKFQSIEGVTYVGTQKRPAGVTKKTSPFCYIIGGDRDPNKKS